MACPTCFNMMFQGAKFCPHCGAPAVTWVSSESELHCPGCDAVLFQGQLGPSVLHQCGKCFGFWVDRATFDRICREAEEQSLPPGLPGAVPPPAPVALPKVRYVKCPSCRSFMNRVNFAECSGVVVDVCREHGTWFDAYELNRIVEFIRAGGLDKARDRKKAELVAERRRAQAARRGAGVDEPAMTFEREVQIGSLPDVVEMIGRLLARR